MKPAGFIREDGTVPVDGSPGDATAPGLTFEPTEGSPHPITPVLLMRRPS
ncbi:hypothetical protein ACFZCG_18940 [Streptomyces tanashiensis]